MAAEEWVGKIAEGNREAFRVVYEKYGKTVYRRALEKTGSKEQAQQVLKNVFRTLLRQLQSSNRDPLLFLLEGLTDLEIGALDSTPVPQEEPKDAAEEPASQPAADEPADAPAPQPEEAPAEAPAEPSGDDRERSVFDRAEEALRSEYDENTLKPEEIREMAEQPTVSNPAPAEPEPEEEEEEEPAAHRGLNIFLVILLVLLILLTIWFGVGVLMMYSIIPKVDLGYSWFNAHLFQLFRF